MKHQKIRGKWYLAGLAVCVLLLGVSLFQVISHYGMCQVIVGTFSYLLMSAYFFYFQIIPPTLLSPTFISFSRRLFQRLSLMLSALHPGAAYDV